MTAFNRRLLLASALTSIVFAYPSLTTLALGQDGPVELDFVTQLEPAEIPALEELIGKFETENPDITINLNHVAYDQILQSLPLQLESGEAPDIMRLTYFELAPYFLDLSPYVDVDYWMQNMAPTQDLLKGDAEAHPVGVFSNVTLTGAFINRTLFEQAGVEIPAADATWDEWVEATRKVADATGTTAMALDRSGHRLLAPAINMGAKIFDAEGNPQLVGDAGFRTFVENFVKWNTDGTMQPDVWAGGGAFRDAREDFINGGLVFYYSGNWQIGTFSEQIGETFDWQAVPGPCGEGGCTAMPGGGIFVAFNQTEHPEAAAKFLDFFAREDNYRYWSETTLDLPQHAGLIESGLEFQASPAAQDALSTFATVSGEVNPIANQVLGSPISGAIYNGIRDRMTQAITGELDVDQAIERMQQDIDTALAARQ